MKIKIINSLAAAALLTGSLGVLQAEKAKSTDAKPAKAKAAKKSDRPSQRAAFIKRFDKDGDGKLNEAERKAAGAARKAQGARQSDRARTRPVPTPAGANATQPQPRESKKPSKLARSLRRRARKDWLRTGNEWAKAVATAVEAVRLVKS